jgi:type I restriction enzyme R subunit
VKKIVAKERTGGHPSKLNGHPEAIVLFNNLGSLPTDSFRWPVEDDDKANLALELDRAMREKAPTGWFGDDAREKQVLNALFPLLGRDRTATQEVFNLIKHQAGYQ